MRIGVLTSSRADFGIYLPLIKALREDSFFELDIIAFGTHLSHFHGHTLDQIINEGFEPKYKIESMLVSDSKESIATAMSLTMMKFSAFWQTHQDDFDIVFSLGDRYEMFAAVAAGIPFQIKFAHLHGGEKTLGAIDNVFRHAISHASHIHFTSTFQYKQRLKEMLDESKYVYHTGALSLDSFSSLKMLDIGEFKNRWQIDLSIPTVLTTFHPETVDSDLNVIFAEELVETILATRQYQYLITMPNSDTSGNSIRRVFEKKLASQKGVFLVENLGTQSYFTAMKHCCFLLGNTSSGIIEAASFGKFVINLGRRQEGRACSENVIHTMIIKEDIECAILEIEKNHKYSGSNIYHRANAADTIIGILKTEKFHE